MNAVRRMRHAMPALLGVVLAASCQAASPATPTPSTLTTVQYVAAVPNTGAFAAVATDGTDVLVYVCDGTPAGITVYEWLKGTLAGTDYNATAADGSTATGRIANGAATGVVTLANGAPLTFNAPTAVRPAGLYRHEEATADGKQVSGWIVLDNGDVRGGILGSGLVVGPGPIGAGVGGTFSWNYYYNYYY
jgi:hypothetical protein